MVTETEEIKKAIQTEEPYKTFVQTAKSYTELQNMAARVGRDFTENGTCLFSPYVDVAELDKFINTLP